MQTWLGPSASEQQVALGPICVERWKRQPKKTLLYGGRGAGRRPVGPGLVATAAVSRGWRESGNDDNLCAGVKFECADGLESQHYYCPCDVRVMLLKGQGSAGGGSLSRTIRWVLTPSQPEIFFGVLPLAEADEQYVIKGGALRVQVELTFHLSVASRIVTPSLPLGTHGGALNALIYGWCLLGSERIRSLAGNDDTGEAARECWDVRRDGSASKASEGPCSSVLPPAPGLLSACPRPPTAFAQEVIPGLLLGSAEAMTKLVELHDAGVGQLLEVHSPSPEQKSPAEPLELEVRMLLLRGCGDTVELVEDQVHDEGPDTEKIPGGSSPPTARRVLRLIEDALESALSGNADATHALVFPRDPRSGEVCAALTAATVAQRFDLTFSEAARYVQTRWAATIDDAWGPVLLSDCKAKEQGVTGNFSANTSDNVRQRSDLDYLADLSDGLWKKDQREFQSTFGAWFTAGARSFKEKACLASVSHWRSSWEPCPGRGALLQVHETGWGSVTEIIRALCASDGACTLNGPAVTIRMLGRLEQGEVFEVPLTIDAEGETWWLMTLICTSGNSGGLWDGIAFLRGANWLMLDTDGSSYELVRRESTGNVRDNWLCNFDLSPVAIMYLKNPKSIQKLCLTKRIEVSQSQKVPDPTPAPGTLNVRVVTEKALQQTEGCFRGARDIASSIVLSFPGSCSLHELNEQIQTKLRIPADRQWLFLIPDILGGPGENDRVIPLTMALSSLERLGRCVTVLLMFQSDTAALPPSECSQPDTGDGQQPSRMPVLVKFFDQKTLRLVILGVLLVAPGDSPLHHLDWLQKRIALLAASGSPALACYQDTGQGALQSLRMDFSFAEQGLRSGEVLVFEVACFGRVKPLPSFGSSGLEEHHGGATGRAAALAQLVRTDDVSMGLFGCMIFASGGSAGKKRAVQPLTADLLPVVRRAVAEESRGIISEDSVELLEFTQNQKVHTKDGVKSGDLVVFHIDLPVRSGVTTEVAQELCKRFAGPEGRHEATLCQRVARYRPRQLFLVAEVSEDGLRAAWHAVALRESSGRQQDLSVDSDGICKVEGSAADDLLPMPLLNALDGPPGPLALRQVWPCTVDCLASPPVILEGLEDPEVVTAAKGPDRKMRRKDRRQQARRKTPERRRSRSPSPSESDSDASDQSTGGESEDPASPLPLGVDAHSLNGAALAPVAQGAAESKCLLCATEGVLTEATLANPVLGTTAISAGSTPEEPIRLPAAAAPSRIRSKYASETLESQDSGVEGDDDSQRSECGNFAATGICYAGKDCMHWHPATAMSVCPEPCPFRADSRERCPFRHLCIFSHSEAERRRPPFVRAKDETSVPSTPGGGLQVGRAPGVGREDTTGGVVKRFLSHTVDLFSALLAQAKALNMHDEVRWTERQLLFLLHKEQPVPSPSGASTVEAAGDRGSAVHSRTLSRSSSVDSFFEGVEREVGRLVAASTPGEMTQPNSPRSGLNTPSVRDRELETEVDMTVEEVPVVPAILREKLLHVTWHEPMVEARQRQPAWADDSRQSMGGFDGRHNPPRPVFGEDSRQSMGGFDGRHGPPAAPNSRSGSIGHHHSGMQPGQPTYQPGIMPSSSFAWHSSPFGISRTPNIRTPVGYFSPARSPTSVSGYCSPITGLGSGIASPQRRSQSGYSSPSAGPASFFPNAATGPAQSGLMRRLMSLREAREEQDDCSSDEQDLGRDGNLLDDLQAGEVNFNVDSSARVPGRRRDLELSMDFMPYIRRGLVPSHGVPCLNALLQALLPCSPLMHLCAQLSWHKLTKQRPAYACMVQIAFQFFNMTRTPTERSVGEHATAPPFDAAAYMEPLLRKFERTRASQTSYSGPTESLPRLARFLLLQLHNECKWPTYSWPSANRSEDSPISQIFATELRPLPGRLSPKNPDNENDQTPFVLQLDATREACSSVSEALKNLPALERCARLPPFLLLQLQRFHRGSEGIPTRVSRHCRVDLRLELEEGTNGGGGSSLAAYELCSAVCHYGEAPDGGHYKALSRYGGGRNASEGHSWYVYDDATVRMRPAAGMVDVLRSEGYHASLLMYRRDDTKPLNICPHGQ